jgi:Cu-Zn family superoxide dismutase
MKSLTLSLAAVAAVSFAAPASAKPTAFAKTTLESRSGSQATGTVEFLQDGKNVIVEAKITGATPGEHGLHLHEKGDCSAADAASAGGHFNPGGHTHAGPTAGQRHAGDYGNLTVGKDGNGTLKLTLKGDAAELTAKEAVGKAIVLHEKQDDLKSQPAGNSGARIACGVVTKATGPSSR